MLLLILGLPIVFILIYKLVLEPFWFWEKFGVIHADWKNYFYVNWIITFRSRSSAYLIQEIYHSVPNTRFHGFHQFNMPGIILKDQDLIKQITIKDFNYFSERNFMSFNSNEPLFGKSLLNLKGQNWHDMRTILSPSFTTNKMKLLFQIIDNCSQKFIKYFIEKQENIVELEMQDAFTRYTNDVIACSVFGIEVDSLKEPNNEFYQKGRLGTDFTRFPTNLKLLFSTIAPRIYNMLRLQILSNEIRTFFTNLGNEAIKLREDGKIVQTDMMQLLIEAKKEHEKQQQKLTQNDEQSTVKSKITNDDIIAQAFTFFFAGFESVSRTMCFMAHELAANSDIQQRLKDEIEEVTEICKGKITYDILMRMKYLDMVVSEVLRKFPVQVATDRRCTKPYVLELKASGEKPIHIPVGTVMVLPEYALHHDPQYFPNPEKFDPDRFSDENKVNINPYVYQPFGVGPKSCIASRFALMEIKLAFFHLLSKFELVPVEKTKIPLILRKSIMTLSSEYGFWLGLKRA